MRVERLLNFVGRYSHAAMFAAGTFTVGLLSPRRRAVISQLARAANYRERPRVVLPEVEISALTCDSTAVSLANPEGVEGNVSLLELLLLARLVRERQPKTIFEIGTFNGRTTRVLAENAAPDARVFTLDLPAEQASQIRVVHKERVFVEKPVSGTLSAGSPVAPKVSQLLGDSATFDFSPYQIDMAFIDGSHAMEYVMNDSHKCLGMLREGRGTLVWHDYGEWEGVTRALHALREHEAVFRGLRHVRGTSLAILELQ